MRYIEIVHKFGCLGYSLLAIICGFLLFPISYPVFHTGDERLVSTVATVEIALISIASALVVVYWRNPGLPMASLVWVPIYFVAYLAVLISYNYDGYVLKDNGIFNEWGVFFLSLLLYQLPVLTIYLYRYWSRR